MEQSDAPAEAQSRILIVEDEIILSKDLERRLKAQGYEVVGKTDSGEDAVRIAEQTRPDLVLMDIKLSDEMDGIEAARRIREQLDTAIVYLTGYSGSELFDRAKPPIRTPLCQNPCPLSNWLAQSRWHSTSIRWNGSGERTASCWTW